MVVGCQKIVAYVESVLKQRPNFTGALEINFKNGEFLDIVEKKRTKAAEIELGAS